jgi:hypothetical protein
VGSRAVKSLWTPRRERIRQIHVRAGEEKSRCSLLP